MHTRRLTKEDRAARAQVALSRALQGETLSNYPAIFEGFAALGIPADQIRPRENVFTYEAWRALGRHVKRGQHGVQVITWIDAAPKSDGADQDDGEERKPYRFPRATTVFHLLQTEPDEVRS